MNDGFSDLRLNCRDGQVSESFWPSFTDIMTTVVMIFLVALVVLLVRNVELVRQLRSTMEAERIAAELARATGKEKDSLAMALHHTEAELRQARLEILHLRKKAVGREKLITDQITTIDRLTEAHNTLERKTNRLATDRQQLEGRLKDQQAHLTMLEQSLKNRELELQASRSDVESLRTNITSLQASLRDAQTRADRLQEDLYERSHALEAVRQAAQVVERKYLVLVGDYDNLKVKYDKLVRPARSPADRHMVEVRYWKEDSQYRIAWHEGSKGEFQPISHKHLDRVLSHLLEQYPNGLYMKVIFPKNSGLSYNEAWKFTNHLHRHYDYYFRDDGTAAKAAPGTSTTGDE